jgi:glycosyltransferase involved in cell wall biosynthesis
MLCKESDILVFSRTYGGNIVPLVFALKKAKKKIVYETDDALEDIDESNPSMAPINSTMGNIKIMSYECDAITTTTPYLAKILEDKYHKKTFVIPNALKISDWTPRTEENEITKIGWSGGCTHSVDMLMMIGAIVRLQEKYPLEFCIQGFTTMPLDAQEFIWRRMNEYTGGKNPQKYYIDKSVEMCEKFRMVKNFKFVPFYPSEMIPNLLCQLHFDIGIAPCLDSAFNRNKSVGKFYEYSLAGALTLASNVIPYTTEPVLVADNNELDWYKKLENLIVDKEYRKKRLQQDREWVIENRDLSKIAVQWENAYKEVLES